MNEPDKDRDSEQPDEKSQGVFSEIVFPISLSSIGVGALGFICCAICSGVAEIVIMVLVALRLGWDHPMHPAEVQFMWPALYGLVGFVLGILTWALTRKRNRPFSIGALVFAIASFGWIAVLGGIVLSYVTDSSFAGIGSSLFAFFLLYCLLHWLIRRKVSSANLPPRGQDRK